MNFLTEDDPWLAPHLPVIRARQALIEEKTRRLTQRGAAGLYDLADYHLTFGLHPHGKGWVFREWAPGARAVTIIGERTGWRPTPEFSLAKTDARGIWEKYFPRTCFQHRDLYRLYVEWPGGAGDRLPSAAGYLVQDPDTLIFNARVWDPPQPFLWHHLPFMPPAGPPLIYEAHVGMAQEEEQVGSYVDFARRILPRIKRAGYNTLQLMAVQEHPYYASFGYHVSGFFAPSSRFGTPDDFRFLVDTAHGLGIRVLMDLVHSHAAKNEVEGLARFDGTRTQFFYPGERGMHPLWDSCCFNYERPAVVRFLLSNCRYWQEMFHIDGFRFDGVTSMVFEDHGIHRVFREYGDYFGRGVDVHALGYLTLANRLIHHINPESLTIAEDVSGYPGMAAPLSRGGVGFDYRFAMGIPDFWIKLLKTYRDEEWPLGTLWHELNARRREEKTISYAESHDQALVGDQTLMMRLMGEAVYSDMRRSDDSLAAFRGCALHRMIRLVTLACAGHGYLNFMGNEFGHPEWIDFPTAVNNWSFRFARRQWSLADNPDLYYSAMARFDRAMIRLARTWELLGIPAPFLCCLHEADKVLAFSRGDLVFVFNFHPLHSFTGYGIAVPCAGRYRGVLCSDDDIYGGKGRVAPDTTHFTYPVDDATEGLGQQLLLYLPSRTAVVLTLLAEYRHGRTGAGASGSAHDKA